MAGGWRHSLEEAKAQPGCTADDDDDEKSLKITPRLNIGHTWATKPTKYFANYWVPIIIHSICLGMKW